MEIHLARGTELLGIFSPDEVRRKLAAGELQPTDLAWFEGEPVWQPVGSLQILAPPAGAAPPPLPPGGVTASPPVGGRAGLGPRVPQETSGLAITSLICGILAYILLPFLMAIPAIICGHVAQGRIRESAGRLGGGGMALAGLIMGYLNFLALPLIAILAGIALPVFSEVQERGKLTKLMSEARQVAVACLLYANDHQDQFPPRLDDLVPDYLPERSPLEHLSAKGVEYFGGTTKDSPRKILFHCTQADKRGRLLTAFVDGSVENYKPVSPPHE